MTPLLLAALALADVAATLDLSDRTEARLRQPGDFPPSSSFDVSSVPEARLALRMPRLDVTLKYDPRLTFWDLNDRSGQPTWLDAGTAHLQWQASEHVRLTLDEDASYGGTAFGALAIPTAAPGTTPRVDVVPPTSAILQYEGSSTTLGSVAQLRRWEFREDVAYIVAGGADGPSRAALPLQKGPTADAVASYSLTPVDRESTTISGEDTTFSSGPVIVLAEADEGWTRSWSPVTQTTLLAGVSRSRVEAAPSIAAVEQTNPVAEADLEEKLGSDQDRVTLRASARLGPVVNRLLGIVDERAQGTVQASWKHRPFEVKAFGSAQQSVPSDGPNATMLFLGELGLAYDVGKALTLEVGGRGLHQQANQPLSTTPSQGATEIIESDITQGVVFVAATLRLPTMRL